MQVLRKWTLWLLCAFGFTVHVAYIIQQILMYSVISSVQLTDDIKIPAPSVSICPYPPWSIEKLINNGLNISCIDVWECLISHYDRLLGFIKLGEEFHLDMIKWDPEEIIESVKIFGESIDPADIVWEVSWLVTIPCFTLNPSKLIGNPAIEKLELIFKIPEMTHSDCFQISSEPCESVEEKCGVSCEDRFKHYIAKNQHHVHFVLIHSDFEDPITAMHNSPSFNSGNRMDITVEYEETEKVVDCVESKDYENCLQKCLSDIILKDSHCHKHWKNTEAVSCKDLESFKNVWNIESNMLRGNNLANISNCQCRQPCLRKEYIITNAEDFSDDQSKIEVKLESLKALRVTELKPHTPMEVLSSIGGAAGLWLGVSLLSCSLAIFEWLWKLVNK